MKDLASRAGARFFLPPRHHSFELPCERVPIGDARRMKQQQLFSQNTRMRPTWKDDRKNRAKNDANLGLQNGTPDRETRGAPHDSVARSEGYRMPARKPTMRLRRWALRCSIFVWMA